ncbi:MAG TPA: germination protein YpeB [Tepidanaerobacteraceae bacterium]|nr:germination protein YpeB [Tepidanaerobacteraceae bacterium]
MKKSYIWLISFLVLGGLIFGYWSISNRAFSAENALEASYQRGFYNLLEHVNSLNLLISKSQVTSSDEQRIMLLTTIWHQSEGARNSLASMPLGNRDMTNMQKFFAQLGDFSYRLAEKLVKKQDVTDSDWAKMNQFRKNIQSLSQELRRLQDNVSAGKIRWQDKPDSLFSTRKIQGMGDSLESIDQKLKKEAPTITYDGPFSDHVESPTVKGVTGKLISESEAVKIARQVVGKISDWDLKADVAGKTKGTIPAYTIEFRREENQAPDIIMDLSETGGHVIWFFNTRQIGSPKIAIKQAVDNAKAFLESMDYKDFEATGSLRENNTITVTFVPKDGEVLLYPDFIKVEVALDTGEIVGFNALAYLTFHTERNLPQPKLTEEEVRAKLNTNLSVDRIQLTLIPDEALNEKLCYEADVRLNSDRYFIYVNAENGIEERILKVVETDKGTMTM